MKTQKNSVRRSLILSATALMISVAMLIGTTFAWFTDSVSSGKNKIVAGNLDIEVKYINRPDHTNWKELTPDVTDFFVDAKTGNSNGKWEPGHTEIAYLQVKNAGTLAVAYQAVVKADNATPFVNQNNETTTLDKYLKYGVLYYDDQSTFDTVARNLTRDQAVEKATTQLASFAGEKQTLEVGQTKYIVLVVTMPTDVGNEANALTQTGNEASIDLTVQINGTQDAVENDSFGPDYDSKAFDDNATTVGTTTVTDEGDTKTVTMTAGDITATLTGTDEKIAASGKTANDLRLVVQKESKPTTSVQDGYTYESLSINVENKAPGAVVKITRNIGANKRGVRVYRGGEIMFTESPTRTEDYYSYDKTSGIVTFVSSVFDIGQSEYDEETRDRSKYDIEWKDKVTSSEELTDAINNDETNIKLGAGTFTLPDSLQDKSFTISGNKDTVINVIDKEKNPSHGTSIAFDGVTVKFGTDNYVGFQHTGSLTYTNCTIYGKQFLYADTVNFTNCDFIQENPDYNVWTYGAKNTTFDNCTFTCKGRAVLVYNEGNNNVTNNVEFKQCTFTASETAKGKAAIEIDSSLMKANPGAEITIDKATAESVKGFDNGTNSGNSVWNNKVGDNATVIVNGETVLQASTTPSPES